MEKHTRSGSTKVIPLTKFLELIPREWVGNALSVKFVARNLPPIVNGRPDEQDMFQSLNERLQSGSLLEIAKRAFLLLPTEYIDNVDLGTAVERGVTRQLYNMALPSFLVRVNRRTWIVTDPNNYRVYKGSHGTFLACLRPDLSPPSYVCPKKSLS